MAKKTLTQGFNVADYYKKEAELGIKGFDDAMTPTATGVDLGKYQDVLGDNVNIYHRGLEKDMSVAQSTGAKILGTINRTLTGEIVGGTIEGVGHLVDLEQTIAALEGETQEWGNWITDIGKGMRTWAEETTPTYTDPANQGKFNPGNADWWFNNIPSIASTLSLMIPAAGVARGASMMGKALNLTQQMGKTTRFIGKGVTQAVASRLMENGMEALGNYEETYGKWVEELGEEGAKKLASQAASGTWNANWVMLAQDIPQYLLLNKAFGKASEKNSSGVNKLIGGSTIMPKLTKSKAIGLDMLGEAGEEAYQYIANEESRHLAEVRAGVKQDSDLGDRLRDYTKEGEFWTSTTMGALGAGAMQIGGKALNNAIINIKGGKTQEQRRVENIANWSAERKLWADRIKEAEEIGTPQDVASAKSGLITSMGLQAAENGNLGILRSMFDEIASKEELSQETMDILGIEEADIPEVKANAQEYIKKLNRIEELYDKNSKRVDDRLVSLVTNEEINLESYEEQASTLRDEVSKLEAEVININDLSAEDKGIFEIKNNLENTKTHLEFLKKRLAKEENLSDNDRASIEVNIVKGEAVLESTTQLLKEAGGKYSKEVTVFRDLKNKQKILSIFENAIIETKDRIKKYNSPKFQSEFDKLLKENSKLTVVDAIKKAGTVEEANTINDEVKDTTAEKDIETKVEEEKVQEAPKYTKPKDKTTPPNVEDIYKDGGLNNTQATLSFIQDRKAIKKAIDKKFKGKVSDQIKPYILKLNTAKSLKEINQVISEIYQIASQGNKEFGDLGNVIHAFFTKKAVAKEKELLKQQEGTQEVVDYEEGSTSYKEDIITTDIPTTVSPFDATLWEMQFDKVPLKKGRVRWDVHYNKKGNPVVAESIIEGDRYNADILGNPNNFLAGSQVTYEVDLDGNYSANTKDEMNFQIQLVSYDLNKKGYVVGVLPSLDKVNVLHPEFKDLKELREKIYKQVKDSGKTTGIFETELTTNIVEKHAGRIWRTGEYVNPKDIVKGTKTPIVYGVAVTKNGQKSIEGLPKQYQHFVSDGFLKKAVPGAVYMFLPAANKEVIPLRVFTKKVRFFTDKTTKKNPIKAKVYKNLIKLFDKGSKLTEVSKAVKEDVYLNFEKPDYKNDLLVIWKSGKPYQFSINGLKTKDVATMEAFSSLLDEMVVQVDVNKINKGNNEKLADRLSLNVNPGRWTHSTRITASSKYYGKKLEGKDSPVEPNPVVDPEGTPTEPIKDTNIKTSETIGDAPTGDVAFTLNIDDMIAGTSETKVSENLQDSEISSTFAELTKTEIKDIISEFSEADMQEAEKIMKKCKGQ